MVHKIKDVSPENGFQSVATELYLYTLAEEGNFLSS